MCMCLCVRVLLRVCVCAYARVCVYVCVHAPTTTKLFGIGPASHAAKSEKED